MNSEKLIHWTDAVYWAAIAAVIYLISAAA